MKLVNFYRSGFSDYCLYLYCYIHSVVNITTKMKTTVRKPWMKKKINRMCQSFIIETRFYKILSHEIELKYLLTGFVLNSFFFFLVGGLFVTFLWHTSKTKVSFICLTHLTHYATNFIIPYKASLLEKKIQKTKNWDVQQRMIYSLVCFLCCLYLILFLLTTWNGSHIYFEKNPNPSIMLTRFLTKISSVLSLIYFTNFFPRIISKTSFLINICNLPYRWGSDYGDYIPFRGVRPPSPKKRDVLGMILNCI